MIQRVYIGYLDLLYEIKVHKDLLRIYHLLIALIHTD